MAMTEDSSNAVSPQFPSRWAHLAMFALRAPTVPLECPECHARLVSAAWHLTDFLSRQAIIDLTCSSCKATHSLNVALPPNAIPFYPIQRMAMLQNVIQEQTESITKRVRLHADAMPAADFTTSPLWQEAKWSGTTFRYNPD